MPVSGGLSVVIALLVFLSIMTLANAIMLSIAHSDLSKNKSLISSENYLATAQNALFIDLIISWVIFAVYVVFAGFIIFVLIGGAFTGVDEVAGAAALAGSAGESTVLATKTGRKATAKLALGTILVLVAVSLLFFGLVIGFESYYALVAARNIIKSPNFTETGSLSTAYWLSFISAALGFGALVLILVAIGSIIMTWVLQKRSKKILGELRDQTTKNALEFSSNIKVGLSKAGILTQ